MEKYQSFSFNGKRKDYILMPVGRKRPAWAPIKRNFLTTPGKPGAILLDTEVEVRQIDVPLIVRAKNIADLQKVKEDLADWLVTPQECELIFDDEPDRTYMAVVDGDFDADELVNRGKGVVTFIAPMPYKLGPVNKIPFVQSWSTETTANFINRGSVEAETPAYIEITAKKPSTFLDVWFGKYPNERNYFRIGYPISAEEKPVQSRERVLWDDMSKVIGWTPVTEKFEDMNGTGSFKVKDGHALYCEDYGQDKGFYGAIAKKNIPGGPIQDFEMEAWVNLRSKSIEEMGRIEVLLLDDSSNLVARINMNDLYVTAEITKAHMKIGSESTPGSLRKLVDTSGFYTTTFNQFRGRLRIARRGKQWSVYVAKFIDGTEIDGASLVERFNDEDNSNPMTNRKIAQVMIALCRWDNHPAVSYMCIEDLKIWKVNNVSENTKPFIFETGDKIIIDTEKSAVKINGKNALNLKDIFSEFPVVIKGENRMDIMPADCNATISFRERYK
ncbi:TPA: phage tail family protein [Bacillus cereus]|nr:phage tail family protein [Bacillus cereus]